MTPARRLSIDIEYKDGCKQVFGSSEYTHRVPGCTIDHSKVEIAPQVAAAKMVGAQIGDAIVEQAVEQVAKDFEKEGRPDMSQVVREAGVDSVGITGHGGAESGEGAGSVGAGEAVQSMDARRSGSNPIQSPPRPTFIKTLRAITLTRPWPWTIFSLPEAIAKDIENRDKQFRGLLAEEWIAIHAGLDFDHDALPFIEKQAGRKVPKDQPCGIVGLVHFSVIVEFASFEGYARSKTDKWFAGPYGHVIDRKVALPQPVACKGKQIMPFAVPDKVAEEVWEMLAKMESGK